MLSVTVKITGDKEEIAKLRKLGDKLMDFTSAMRTIGDELKSYYANDVFDSRGGVYGTAWVPLSPVYRNWKLKHYRNGSANLRLTGQMQKSFRATTTKNSVVIDNTRITANGRNLLEIHQKGLGHNPVRRVLLINTTVENKVKAIIDKDVHEKINTVL